MLTLLPVTFPAFPFLLYLFPTPSAHSYTPPQDQLVLVSLVRGRLGAVDEVDTKSTSSRVWRSFKLRPFSIAISIFIVAHFTGMLKL